MVNPLYNDALWFHQFGLPEQTLTLQRDNLKPLRPGFLRVKMHLAPVNASDLIPITGAYGHRVVPPLVAGYEGVGIVMDAPQNYRHLLGKRVLPLRGDGTWQTLVDCPAALAIPVPDNIGDRLPARAFINPVAALMMLRLYPPRGQHILLTAAGSDCGLLLGQWALKLGAATVTGIHRSPIHGPRIAACGIRPILQGHSEEVLAAASHSDRVFDAVGGELGGAIVERLAPSASFIGYGALSGKTFRQSGLLPAVHWFHIVNYLDAMDETQWQGIFRDIWPLLQSSRRSDTVTFPLGDWQRAIEAYRTSGRVAKPLLDLTQ